jgi:dTDP-4-amino-4,6-dideoxygalactose transaminase
LRLIATSGQEKHNRQYVVVEIDEQEAGMSRDAIQAALHTENVLAKRYFAPGCHRMRAYRDLHDLARSPLPHTDMLCERLLQLPTGMAVTRNAIGQIGELLCGMTARQRRAA